MLHGIARAIHEPIREERTRFVEQLFTEFPIVAIDTGTARVHAKLWADFERAGTMIGQHDLWISATALLNNLIVVTANEREFRRVPGLVVENWLSP